MNSIVSMSLFVRKYTIQSTSILSRINHFWRLFLISINMRSIMRQQWRPWNFYSQWFSTWIILIIVIISRRDCFEDENNLIGSQVVMVKSVRKKKNSNTTNCVLYYTWDLKQKSMTNYNIMALRSNVLNKYIYIFF